MTPAILAAKRAKVRYCVHEYAHNPTSGSFGEEAAEMLEIDPRQVFKTLLVSLYGSKQQFGVGIVPVAKQLDLKLYAAVFKAKKAAMAEAKAAERITGYVIGGISPLGQKKSLKTVLDISALDYETIYVSAGKRGLEIQLEPLDLKRLCNAQVAHISR